MVEILYVQNGKLIVRSSGYSVVPRIGDKVKIDGCIVKVKDVVWHVDDITWVEVQIDF